MCYNKVKYGKWEKLDPDQFDSDQVDPNQTAFTLATKVDPDQIDPHQIAFTLRTKLIQIILICIELIRNQIYVQTVIAFTLQQCKFDPHQLDLDQVGL